LTVALAIALLVASIVSVANAETAREATAQKLCPIMGGEVDKSVYVDYRGKRVYFCCPGCKETFLKEPAKYIEQMESQGISLERASGTHKTSEKDHAHQHKGHGSQ
jgi:YHS domain-containing protein